MLFLLVTSAWLLLAELALIAIVRGGFSGPLSGVGLWMLLVLSTALFLAFAAREVIRFRRDERVLRRHEDTLVALAALTEPSLQEVAFEDLVRDAAEAARRVLGASAVAIYLVPEPDRAPELAARASRSGGGSSFGIADVGFAAEVVAQRQPLWRTADGQGAAAAPISGDLSVAGSPMIVVDRVTGICVAQKADDGQFDAASLRLLKLVTNHLAVRLERARLDGLERKARQAAEHAQAQVSVLAGAGGVLGPAIEGYQAGLEALSAVIVPAFADWCAVDLSEDGSPSTRVVARGVEEQGPLFPDIVADGSRLSRECLRTGWPQLVVVSPATGGAPASLMVAPLSVGDRVVGVITFGTVGPRTPFETSDLAIAVEVASRASAAVERVGLYREARRSAEESTRMASHLRLLVDASLSLKHLRSRTQIASQAANAARVVLGGELAVAIAPSASDPPFARACARSDRSVECELVASGELPAELSGLAEESESAITVQFVGRDGAKGSLGVSSSALGRDDGQTLLVLLGQLVSAALDELAQYQQAVRREDRWHAVIEATPAAIVEVSLDHRVLLWNRSASNLFGWPPHDRGTQRRAEFDEQARTALRELWTLAAAAETTVEHEVTIASAGGDERDLQISVAPLSSDGAVYGTLMLATDVTEANRFRRSMARAEQVEAVGKLAGTVAHDFNNLLTVIGGYTDLLSRRSWASGADRELLDGVRTAVDRAAVLTKQLLAISSRKDSNPVVVDTNAALGAMDDVLQRILGVDIRLVWQLDPAAGHIRIDPASLEQVVLNLAINARDAISGAGVLTISTDSVSVAEDVTDTLDRAPGEYLRLQVIDTGSGMDEATRRRCFEAFFTTKDGTKGTGLGLAAVQNIVTESGGAIEVSSELGHGSTFTVYLPRVAPAVAAEAPITAASRTRQGSEVVLLVEDNDDVRRLVRRILEREGYLVLEAESGPTAVRIAGDWEGPIELLISDVVMPGMRGPGVAAAVTALRPTCKVLYISAYLDGIGLDGTGDHAVLLAKPFRPSELLGQVRTLLDGGRRRLVRSDVAPLARPIGYDAAGSGGSKR